MTIDWMNVVSVAALEINSTTNSTTTSGSLIIPLYVIIIIAISLVILFLCVYMTCFIPSTNKKKIHRMMKEAKLEDDDF